MSLPYGAGCLRAVCCVNVMWVRAWRGVLSCRAGRDFEISALVIKA